MNRIIKFRAWIEDDDKWFMTYDLAFEEYETINNLLGGVEHLMQYTGLRDKNGKEIYEGDIITFDVHEWNRSSMKPKSEWEYPRWVVEWDDINAEWEIGGGTNSETSSFKEVIGNIYENPELIKK